MMRHTLDSQTVKAIRTRMQNRTKGYALVRSRYVRLAQEHCGMTLRQALAAYEDCHDTAELEHNART
jgi:hypothetical protein